MKFKVSYFIARLNFGIEIRCERLKQTGDIRSGFNTEYTFFYLRSVLRDFVFIEFIIKFTQQVSAES